MIAPITAIRTTRHASDADNDSFIDSDIGYPNRRAQRRGYRILIGLILLGGVVALIGGLVQGADRIAAAFPTGQSLADGAAWGRFFGGLGQMATIGLMVVVVALILRWRARRRRAPK